jgi:two-component system LytT family sensor kinase
MHPILTNKKSRLYFVLAWILITVIHVLVLIFFYSAEFKNALIDGIIFNIILAAIAMGMWYPVRFMKSGESSKIGLVLNHIGVGILTISLWLTTGYFILESILREKIEYITFLDQSMPWRVVSGVLIYLVLLLIYYLILYYVDLQEKIRLEADLKTLVKESELNMLKSQINPHFIFNSLNSINSLILTDHQKAQNMVIKLSEFLRYALKYHQKEKTRLDEELYNINLYLEIEKIRFGEKLLIENNIPEQFGKCLLPNMILQPLIENTIKHGVYESTETVKIYMEALISDDYLNITITNNFDPEQPAKNGNGLGLKNIQNRMMLIYNRDDLFTYRRSDDVFITQLSVPYEV